MATSDPALDDDEFGAAFTGKKVSPGPTQSIMDPAPAPEGAGGFLDNPADRAALLQIGLNLMQPVAMGQSTIGHIGQAVGAGGEAATRGEEADLKQKQAESKLAIADERLRIAQQNADTRERRATGRAIGGLSAAMQYRMSRDDLKDAAAAKKETDKELHDEAKGIRDYVKGQFDPDDPKVKKYGKMTETEIQRALQAERTAAGGAGGAAATGPAPGTQRKQNGVTFTLQPDGKTWLPQ
jgi:hypothetical protein